jgi:hypothetical protein
VTRALTMCAWKAVMSSQNSFHEECDVYKRINKENHVDSTYIHIYVHTYTHTYN